MKTLHMIAFVLVIIGGINWGLTAIGFNVVSMLLGGFPFVEDLVYILVGISAVYLAIKHTTECKTCDSSAAA